MPTRTTEIPAIFSSEAEPLMDRLGVGNAYRAGDLLCDCCGQPIKDHGLGAVMLRGEEILASCAQVECLEQLSG